MPRPKHPVEPELTPRVFTTVAEIDAAILKLERRIKEVEALDVVRAVREATGEDVVVQSSMRETIREVFGTNSPEFKEHEHISIWAGPMRIGMGEYEIIEARERGKTYVANIVRGLIARLKEKRDDLIAGASPPSPSSYIKDLNLHPRIASVSEDLFRDGYPWEAVFAAAKALVNFVKEKSGRHDLDGAALMRTVFSRNDPILAFNGLRDQTDMDEQEGMMHLFEGAVLAIRNPGGHTFPEGPEQRALAYLELLSLLAFRTEEARRTRRNSPPI